MRSKETLMVQRKLPSELEEEILIRVPPSSLARFRAVCKEWNVLFSDKRFANNQLACARPEFMLQTDSNVFSISVNLNDDPTIQVRKLTIDFPGFHYCNCDGYFFLYDLLHNRVAVSNPWLRQTKRIGCALDEPFTLCGMGYDSSRPEKSYKIFGFTYCCLNALQYKRFVIFDFETNAWKFIDHANNLENSTSERWWRYNNVSLNGNLFSTAYDCETGQYFIRIVDFSKEIVKPFCILPCEKKDSNHTHALAVYKGDRFSLLEQCYKTRKIEIWVTKKKISNGDDGDNVVWIKFMTVSIPNFPRFNHTFSRYMVDNNIYGKTFVMCCPDDPDDKTRRAWVYVVRGDLCKKINIDHLVDGSTCSLCCVYVPSLMPITLYEENKKNLQV